MRKVELPKWGDAYEWQGLEEFLATEVVPDGVQRVKLSTASGSELSLDLFVHLTPGTPMMVHFYGAQGIPRRSLAPIFRGLPTSQALSSSYVLLHDPTLSLSTDIGLSWYEGYKGIALAPSIRAVLSHLVQISAAPRTVLWGGSAGGYAALRHVGTIPNSTALVWNPQTSILRYQPAPIRRYARIGFGTDDLAIGADSTPGIVLDLAQLPRPNWIDAPVVYLQEADDRHVRQHLSYLLRPHYPEASAEVCRRDTMFGLLSPNFYLHLSSWEPGHAPPPKTAINAFLRRLLDMTSPVTEVLAQLDETSREFIRSVREPRRAALPFELDAPVDTPEQTLRVIQWGSRFGRESTGQATLSTQIQVSRSVVGQSLITAFSVRKKPAPKTALDMAATDSNEQRQILLRDRRASGRNALSDDPSVDLIVLDLLEEVRGTVNAGNGYIVTNHGLIRRTDGVALTVHTFGTVQHRVLWESRLNRLQAAVRSAGAQLVILDIDATGLQRDDWEWLGIPCPPDDVLDHWSHMVDEARARLTGAIWIDHPALELPLSELIAKSGTSLAGAIADTQSRPKMSRE